MWVRMEIPKFPRIRNRVRNEEGQRSGRYLNLDPKHATQRLAEKNPKFKISWENQLVRRERPASGISQFLN